MGKRTTAWGSGIVALFIFWAALANIWPKGFQVSVESPWSGLGRMLNYVWNPALIWLALPLAAAWFGYVTLDIYKKLDTLVNFRNAMTMLEESLSGVRSEQVGNQNLQSLWRAKQEDTLNELTRKFEKHSNSPHREDTGDIEARLNTAVQRLREELLAKAATPIITARAETPQQTRRREILREGKDLLDAMAMNDGDAFLKLHDWVFTNGQYIQKRKPGVDVDSGSIEERAARIIEAMESIHRDDL